MASLALIDKVASITRKESLPSGFNKIWERARYAGYDIKALKA
jgi:hypothetical protein